MGGVETHAGSAEPPTWPTRAPKPKNEVRRSRTMPSSQKHTSAIATLAPPLGMFAPAMEYMVDAAQRSVLFWDVFRQRGNRYREHLAETAPHVLDYEVELVVDGRTLERPVNYALARVVPPP